MTNDILIRSTAKNWIVSIRKTYTSGKTSTAPVATISRRAYAAAALAGAVTATQKLFLIDNVVIDTDRDGIHLLASLGVIEAQIAAKAYEMADRGDAIQNGRA